MNTKSARLSLTLATAVLALACALPAVAHDGRFERHHPRRDQVLDRVQRQDHRITHRVREGELDHRQAYALRRHDAWIAMRERRMAYRHGGYITRHQQARLNRHLDRNGWRIGR